MGLPADRLPMILGCDGAGVDADGNEVIVHAVVASEGWQGDETLDPRRTLLSELHDGTLAEKVLVPTANVVPKPAGAVVGARRLPLHGLAHGIPDALHQLRRARPARPCSCRAPAVASPPRWSSSARRPATGCGSPAATRPRAPRRVEIGADRAFASGERLPERVDAVMETVGAATWSHSVKSLKPGGTIVICGATSGDAPPKAELTKIFFRQLRVIGSTMGTRLELERLAQFVVQQGIEPVIDTGAAAGAGARGVRQDGGRRPVRQGRLHGRLRSAGAHQARPNGLSASGLFGLSNRRELCKCDVCFNNSLPNHGHS